MRDDKIFSVSTIRVSVPVLTLPNAPVVAQITCQHETLEYIELFVQASVLDAGVRVRDGSVVIYPGQPSVVPASYAGGATAYGGLPASASFPMRIPIGRKLKGPPYQLTFEFYNNTAAAIFPYALVVTSEKRQKTTRELREEK